MQEYSYIINFMEAKAVESIFRIQLHCMAEYLLSISNTYLSNTDPLSLIINNKDFIKVKIKFTVDKSYRSSSENDINDKKVFSTGAIKWRLIPLKSSKQIYKANSQVSHNIFWNILDPVTNEVHC